MCCWWQFSCWTSLAYIIKWNVVNVEVVKLPPSVAHPIGKRLILITIAYRNPRELGILGARTHCIIYIDVSMHTCVFHACLCCSMQPPQEF